jgi:hypothetical protein
MNPWMARFPFIVLTIPCTAAGWLLGSFREIDVRPPQVIVLNERTSHDTPTAEPLPFAPAPSRAQEIIEKINAEFPEQHQLSERAARLFSEFRDLKNDEFAGVIATLGSRGDWWSGDAARLVLGYWAERDLKGALAWTLGLDGKNAEMRARALFETWSRMDAGRMLEWLEKNAKTLPTKAHRDGAMFQMAKATWQTDPERGIALLK